MSAFSYSQSRSYRDTSKSERTSDDKDDPSATPSRSDLDEQRVRAKSGRRVLSSMSDLLLVLAKSGIQGPKDLETININERCKRIGSGAQFDVFQNDPSIAGLTGKGYGGLEGLVVKRVKMTNFRGNGKDLIETENYRRKMMSLELEVLALCHPSISKHRNITRLIAWGRDYLDPETILPALFVEAAKCSLDDFLRGRIQWEIKHQISLDIASGLELLHKYHIVHGDLKPENILIFEHDNAKVPFVAKLSDFGLCIDLFNSKNEIGIHDYLGTRDWNAPELHKDQVEIHTGVQFEIGAMFSFDTYSYGLVLVSIFCTLGKAPQLNARQGTRAEVAVGLFRDKPELPSSLKSKLCSAVENFLDENPLQRLPPTVETLKTDDLPSYREWFISYAIPSISREIKGVTDPELNQGPRFWARTDRTLIHDMAISAQKVGSKSPVHAETLFGIAMGMSSNPVSEYIDVVVDLIRRASVLGYKPAQAICQQICLAHNKPVPSRETLAEWEKNSLESGIMFTPGTSVLTSEEINTAKDVFRNAGGFGNSGFTSIPHILEMVSDILRIEELILKEGSFHPVDLDGNSIAHIMAALGLCKPLTSLLNKYPQESKATNDNGETLLYKACQAGHIGILQVLRGFGEKLSIIGTLKENLTPLHWLFMFKDSDIAIACEYLVARGQLVNCQMVPIDIASNSGTLHKTHFMISHYPFELPYGTPLHWACASRNFVAMEVLLRHGADVDAKCFNIHAHTTPLALAVHCGDVEKSASPIVNQFPRTLWVLPSQWHSWIRHGNWKNHLSAMSKVVDLLLCAGAELESLSTGYTPLTPLLTAASENIRCNEGAMLALINAGADASNPKASCDDSALILCSSVASENLAYPTGYPQIMKAIIGGTKDLSHANRFNKQTALHVVSGLKSSRDQFESNISALFSEPSPPNIEAVNDYGSTPLLWSLSETSDAQFRAKILLEHGADIYFVNSRGENIIGAIAGNKNLMDDDSLVLIKTLLLRVDETFESAYREFNESSKAALWNCSMFARPKTLQFLLDLGLNKYINEVKLERNESAKTALDIALDNGENSRHQHIGYLSAYLETPSSKLMEDSSCQAYSAFQGGQKRAYEAYWAFPTTIQILMKHGAKRAWQLGTEYDCENIWQPQDYDFVNIYVAGFSPSTQPNREHWSVLYELAKYKDTWVEEQICALIPWYQDGTFVPSITTLENRPELVDGLQKISKDGYIKAVSREQRIVKVRVEDRKIVEKR
ncbi:hypothetical protein HYFRA_00005242 [Hymenoscyphus fraxineus]|uniref:Protein kinase domain-containing protein n=1 Tax=Hymenoscyphus fraxineus TaxID=746836 RepID=A0A9N9LBX6_9HELO|nr:hypothetical protein HYFRA_00005242 [Hymenoscyphus fraxineus]